MPVRPPMDLRAIRPPVRGKLLRTCQPRRDRRTAEPGDPPTYPAPEGGDAHAMLSSGGGMWLAPIGPMDLDQRIQRNALERILANVETAMLSTVDREGTIAARPMLVACHAPADQLWFLSRFDTSKVQQALAEQRALVTYQ